MNQTSTAAAIATVIGAYTGLIGMIGFLMFATRNKAVEPRRRAIAPVAEPTPQVDVPAAAGGQVVGPRRAADEVVTVG